MADIYLPADSQQRLIEIARQTLEGAIRGRRYAQSSGLDPYLEQIGYGAFVTLFNRTILRGCIGICAPSSSLRQVVIQMTEAAATRDCRVKPVRAHELDQIRIDISVTSPLERTDDPLALEVGKHGLHVSHDQNRGVLLPQVAIQQHWSPTTFLEQVCLKANLPVDAWLWPDTEISLFTALVIEEER
jgi:uncharacterized protein